MFYGDDLLFIHIPKNAGTSIIRALLEKHGGGRQTLHTHRLGLKKHVPAYTAQVRLPDQAWRKAFKFAVVRNPWERMVSTWRYGRHQTKRKGRIGILDGLPLNEQRRIKAAILTRDFNWWLFEFCRKYRWFPAHEFQGQPPLEDGNPPSQCNWFYLGENLLLDKIYRFEALDELESDIGVTLQHLNASPLPDGPYQDHYDGRSKAWVAEVFAEDIERFGYSFAGNADK